MVRAQGVSPATVQRIWDAHGLKPHRVRTFKLSRDPAFVAKLTDVVGLYLNPPDQAVVLCVDEKSQIQALVRTQPGLPMKRGRAGTMTTSVTAPPPCSPRSTCRRARSSVSACRATVTRSSSRSCAGSTASSRRGCPST